MYQDKDKTMKVCQEIDVDNVTIIINSENKLACVPTPTQEMKVFTDETLGYLMDSCGCGAYITRTANGEDTNIVVDYVKFTTKYTKGDHTVYAGVAESGKEYVTTKGVTDNNIVDAEGYVTWSREGVQINTTKDLSSYADYQKEVLGDCCGVDIEELPHTTFVDDNNVPNDYALRLVVGDQEVGIDRIGKIKGTDWLVFRASKFSL